MFWTPVCLLAFSGCSFHCPSSHQAEASACSGFCAQQRCLDTLPLCTSLRFDCRRRPGALVEDQEPACTGELRVSMCTMATLLRWRGGVRPVCREDKWRGNWSESSRLWTPELRQRVGAAKAMEAEAAHSRIACGTGDPPELGSWARPLSGRHVLHGLRRLLEMATA